MALLTSNEDGANFTLYDNNGNTRMKMVVDYSSVELIDVNRRTTLALKEQGLALTFYDSNDTTKALLGMIGKNYTIISFHDDNEQPMMVLDIDGHKSNIVLAPNGKPVIQMSMEDGVPHIEIFDKEGQIIY